MYILVFETKKNEKLTKETDQNHKDVTIELPFILLRVLVVKKIWIFIGFLVGNIFLVLQEVV